jgi:hypothetical protein
MAKRRYSNSRKRKSRRGKKSRHTRHTKHTKHHDGRRNHHTRRRAHRGGASNPGPPGIFWPLKQNQLLSGLNYQRGGSTTSTGGNMVYNKGQWVSRNPASPDGGRT